MIHLEAMLAPVMCTSYMLEASALEKICGKNTRPLTDEEVNNLNIEFDKKYQKKFYWLKKEEIEKILTNDGYKIINLAFDPTKTGQILLNLILHPIKGVTGPIFKNVITFKYSAWFKFLFNNDHIIKIIGYVNDKEEKILLVFVN